MKKNLTQSQKHLLSNIHVIRIPKEEEEIDSKNIFKEIIAGNFPNSLKIQYLWIQEAQCNPNGLNSMKMTPCCIITKLLKIKSD